MSPVVLFIILLVAYAFLMPKPNKNNSGMTPGSFGDLNMPTAEAGRVLPVGFGTFQVKSSNVCWYGDYGTTEIRKTGDDVDGPCCSCCGPDPSDYSTVVGYRYYVGMDLGLCCGPVDKFLAIMVDDKILWQGDLTGPNPQTLNINKPNFMGGDEKQGGIIANLHLYFGSMDQPADDYFRGQTGCKSGYQGICRVVVPGKSQNSGYIGTSTYMQPWHFVLKRIPNRLGLGAAAEINGDANPAEIMYELLTDDFWGASVKPDTIDTKTFVDAGKVLASELLGMSLLLDSQQTCEDIINDVKKYINATVYTNPATGLLELKLIRDDYDINTLPRLDPSNVIDIKQTSAGWYETVNEIKVNYTERMLAYNPQSSGDTNEDGIPDNEVQYAFKTRTAQAQDLANYFLQDEAILSTTMGLPALSNMSIATNVAYKNLSTASQPFAKLELTANRETADLLPGAPFRVDWPDYQYYGKVFRVIDTEDGELVDSNVKISALEDIFGIAHGAYGKITETTPGWTNWKPINTDPAPIVYTQLVEVPYISWSLERIIVAMVSRPNKNTDKYRSYGRVDEEKGFYYLTDNKNFMPCATLVGVYKAESDAIDEVGFRIKAISDCDALVSVTQADLLNTARNGCWIDGEMMAWRDVIDEGGGYYTIKGVARGVADTVPAEHTNGSRVWIVSLTPGKTKAGLPVGVNLVQNPAVYAISSPMVEPPIGRLTTDMTFYTKFVPGSSSGFLEDSKGTKASITTKSRAWRPYPPGRIRVNNEAWPKQLHISASQALQITWAHREKLFQQTRTQDDVSDPLEANTEYVVNVYCNNNLAYTFSKITTDHLDITLNDFTNLLKYTPSNIIPIMVQLEIYATNTQNGLESWQKQVRQFTLWGS